MDPVGAGDTFLAGVLRGLGGPVDHGRLDGPDPDLRLGAACGSLILEGPGLFGVPYLAAARERLLGGRGHTPEKRPPGD